MQSYKFLILFYFILNCFSTKIYYNDTFSNNTIENITYYQKLNYNTKEYTDSIIQNIEFIILLSLVLIFISFCVFNLIVIYKYIKSQKLVIITL